MTEDKILAVEARTYAVLDKLQVQYKQYRHEPVFTVAAAEELDKVMGMQICKNLFLSSRHQSEFFLLLMDGSKKFPSGKVSKQLGVPRLTFADSQYLKEFLSLMPGSVTPLGLLQDVDNRVRLLIDSDLMQREEIAIHPCVNTATIVIKTTDLLEKILPYCGHSYKIVVL